MKTLADLKRDAKAGKITAEMVYRFGEPIPDRLTGKRKVIDANSVGITFLNADGKKSELNITAASLAEYTDESISIFNPGLRDLSAAEQAIFDKWETMRNPEQENIDALSDGSCEYWRRKHFFVDAGYEYLLGHERKQGMKYDYNTRKVSDNKIKGDMIMKYAIT